MGSGEGRGGGRKGEGRGARGEGRGGVSPDHTLHASSFVFSNVHEQTFVFQNLPQFTHTDQRQPFTTMQATGDGRDQKEKHGGCY